jgi:ATPase subunit of ABC transporter with duplicated ATPase domains
VDTLLWDGNCDTPQEARDRLAAFSFRGEEVFKTVGVLSGGEKTRLRLCQFMGTGVNTLFLDEPTNHLDILSREWVEDAIDEFSETVIFVSHDRYFINRFATRIWQIMPDGTIRDYIGTYEDFRAMLQREQAQAASMAAPKEKKPESSKKTASPNKKSGKAAEKAVEKLEARLGEIEQQMADNPQDYQLLQQLCEEKDQLEEQLLELYEQLSPV